MALQILKTSQESDTLTLTLNGSLDTTTSSELEQYATAQLGEATRTLVLDLANLTFVSSAGLRTFAKLRKQMQSRNGALCFVNLSPQVQKVFEIVKAVPLSEVFRSHDELDEYLAAMQRKVGKD